MVARPGGSRGEAGRLPERGRRAPIGARLCKRLCPVLKAGTAPLDRSRGAVPAGALCVLRRPCSPVLGSWGWEQLLRRRCAASLAVDAFSHMPLPLRLAVCARAAGPQVRERGGRPAHLGVRNHGGQAHGEEAVGLRGRRHCGAKRRRAAGRAPPRVWCARASHLRAWLLMLHRCTRPSSSSRRLRRPSRCPSARGSTRAAFLADAGAPPTHSWTPVGTSPRWVPAGARGGAECIIPRATTLAGPTTCGRVRPGMARGPGDGIMRGGVWCRGVSPPSGALLLLESSFFVGCVAVAAAVARGVRRPVGVLPVQVSQRPDAGRACVRAAQASIVEHRQGQELLGGAWRGTSGGSKSCSLGWREVARKQGALCAVCFCASGRSSLLLFFRAWCFWAAMSRQRGGGAGALCSA